MAFRAIGDSVIVRVPQHQKETVRESGLVIFQQDNGQQKTTVTAEVVSTGEGRYDEKNGAYIPLEIKVGDKVVLNLSTGVELDATHRMVKVDDIFAVVE